jgi:hypothetical protein
VPGGHFYCIHRPLQPYSHLPVDPSHPSVIAPTLTGPGSGGHFLCARGKLAGMNRCQHCGSNVSRHELQCPICNMPIEDLHFPIGHAFIISLIGVAIIAALIFSIQTH